MKSSTKRRRIVRRPASGSRIPDSRGRRVLGARASRPQHAGGVGFSGTASAALPGRMDGFPLSRERRKRAGRPRSQDAPIPGSQPAFGSGYAGLGLGRHAEAKARHLPIGSGVVEAACKTLVTQGLKRLGMRWRHAGGLPPAYCLPGQAPSAGIGGQAILTLRALMQSGRFDSAWEMLSGTDRREVTIPDNVAPFPCKQAV